jgi:hypothetical protein
LINNDGSINLINEDGSQIKVCAFLNFKIAEFKKNT